MMLKELVKVANRLDSLGLQKEATILDRLIQKMAGESMLEQSLSEEEMDKMVLENLYNRLDQLESDMDFAAKIGSEKMMDDIADKIKKVKDAIKHIRNKKLILPEKMASEDLMNKHYEAHGERLTRMMDEIERDRTAAGALVYVRKGNGEVVQERVKVGDKVRKGPFQYTLTSAGMTSFGKPYLSGKTSPNAPTDVLSNSEEYPFSEIERREDIELARKQDYQRVKDFHSARDNEYRKLRL